MRGRKVTLSVAGGSGYHLFVAGDVAADLGVSTLGAQRERLHFGRRSRAVRVAAVAGLDDGSVTVTKRAARSLLLPRAAELILFRAGDGGLRLGPYVGVLISSYKMASLRKGHTDPEYMGFVRYATELSGYLVFFTIKDIDAARDRVRAFRVVGGKLRWVVVPLPRVVYDRCFGPGSRRQAYRLRKLARSKGIVVVNRPVKITKLRTYYVLRKDPELRDVIPYANRLTLRRLEAALNQHPNLYLKPNSLSRGQGVRRVERKGGKLVLWSTGRKGPRRKIFNNAAAVLRQLPGFGVPYLLQETIDLATYYGNRYDFRALMQKDAAGTWQMTGLVARLAPKRGVVTSPRSGGRISPADRVLYHSFGPERGRQVMQKLQATCLRIAGRIEAAYGLCAELGLDMAVTKDGQIKLIEVNGRPLRVSLQRLNDAGINGRIARYPIQYAATLDLRP